MPTLLIVPTYRQLEVARRCVQTALDSMPPDTHALIIDDCSPDWIDGVFDNLDVNRVCILRNQKRTGSMTDAWNRGLVYARSGGFDTVVLPNSDILFPKGWWEPMAAAMSRFPNRMAGPMTNAPGSRPEQNIRRFVPDYTPDDSQEAIELTQQSLAALGRRTENGAVNGFCMAARTEAWFAGAYSKEFVFNPRYKLAGNEDEWQKRVEKQGRQSVRVFGSFVFHYRGLSRGLTGSVKGYFRKDKHEKVEDTTD
jgi:glycosyltransferase involved in cell wall biosynthesis